MGIGVNLTVRVRVPADGPPAEPAKIGAAAWAGHVVAAAALFDGPLAARAGSRELGDVRLRQFELSPVLALKLPAAAADVLGSR